MTGLPAIAGASTTVRLPKTNVFSPDGLLAMMTAISTKGRYEPPRFARPRCDPAGGRAAVPQALRLEGRCAAHPGSVVYARTAPKVGKVTVQLVIDPTLADYKRRTAELVEVLAAFEQRSPLDVLGDLLLPPSDALHCRIHSDAVQSGFILLDDSIRMRQAQRQLLLACAHSELRAEEPLPRLAQTEAVELLRSCRRARAPAELRDDPGRAGGPAVGQLAMEPFARRVTRRLMEALGETARLCETQDADGLLSRAKLGISANFLLALSELRPPGERSFVELGVTCRAAARARCWSGRGCAFLRRGVRAAHGSWTGAARSVPDARGGGRGVRGAVGAEGGGGRGRGDRARDRPRGSAGTSMVHVGPRAGDYARRSTRQSRAARAGERYVEGRAADAHDREARRARGARA